MKRLEGYYWVKYKYSFKATYRDSWEIEYWSCDQWYLEDDAVQDDHFEEIDERRIERQKSKSITLTVEKKELI